MIFRRPSYFSWRQKWDEELSKHEITNGNLVCMEHFAQSDEASAEKENECIEYLDSSDCDGENYDENRNEVPIDNFVDACNQCELYEEQLQALIVRCTELEKELAEQTTTLNEKITLQSTEISVLKQTNHSQQENISSLKKVINENELKKIL